MSSSSLGSSISVERAFPTSVRDSSCASQRDVDSYRRAFSIATAACAARSSTDLLVLVSEFLAAGFLRQVQVPVGHAPEEDRHTEERPHRRVVGREPDRLGMRAEIREAKRLRIADEHAEDAAPRGGGPIASTVSSSRPVVTNFSTPLPRWSITPSAA